MGVNHHFCWKVGRDSNKYMKEMELAFDGFKCNGLDISLERDDHGLGFKPRTE